MMNYEAIIKKIQQYRPVVGDEVSDKFEALITSATEQLVEELRSSKMEDQVKVRYAGYMFSKALADLASMLEPPSVLN